MTLCRTMTLVTVLLGVPLHAALAQFGGMPGLPGSAPTGSNPFGAPAAPPAACTELVALRDQTQKHATAIGAANERKAPPQEACKLFNTFLASESKLIKGVDDNGPRCGIPPGTSKEMKTSHAKVAEIAKKVCEVAAHPRPTGPTLGDVFGTSTVPDKPDSTKKPAGNTFETLTGNALGK
jgi:hypothetical protein